MKLSSKIQRTFPGPANAGLRSVIRRAFADAPVGTTVAEVIYRPVERRIAFTGLGRVKLRHLVEEVLDPTRGAVWDLRADGSVTR